MISKIATEANLWNGQLLLGHNKGEASPFVDIVSNSVDCPETGRDLFAKPQPKEQAGAGIS